MTEQELFRDACAKALASQLLDLRGDESRETMAEKCGVSPRYYSNLEGRTHETSANVLIKTFKAGVDLNKWATDTIELYEARCKECSLADDE